jgi:aspartyl-tRNA(Asn)/glutamyl-tRNA(Gln) amidotransferase subunit C
MNDGPKVDIKALADLARLELSDVEMAALEKEIPDILKFVEQIQSVATDAKPTSPELRNVMRADDNPHESGEYTERLLKAAPKSENDRIVVKQVVSRKQK